MRGSQWPAVLLALAAAAPAPRDHTSDAAWPDAAWPDWQTIIYQPQTPAQLARLRRMGVTAGKIFADRSDAPNPPPPGPAVAPFLQAGMRFYVENIATDFYAAYHRWQPDRPVNAAFLAARRAHLDDPASLAPFRRDPALADPAWLARITARITRTVQRFAPFRPLYYDLADEPGIGDLAAAWDFDLSAGSLAGMRVWLRGQYGSLAALNQEWGTGFSRWDDVMPRTTDAAVRQKGENFAAWCDFKDWMDVAFSHAVRTGTDAVHAADPAALAAIEGGQIPGWGGYDYGRLAGAVDAWEIYDVDADLDLARDLNPRLVTLITQAPGDPHGTYALWRALLRGVRGVILWDENHELAGADGAPGVWGRQVGPLLRELRDGLPALLFASRRETGPVAILDSPASRRVAWLLARRAGGPDWSTRDAQAEYADTPMRAATRAAVAAVIGAGLQPRFVSPDMIRGGALRTDGTRLLVLPQTLALSAGEAAAIGDFVRHGGRIVADVVPGTFDGHGRRLAQPALAGIFATGPFAKGGGSLLPLAAVLAAEGIGAPWRVQGADVAVWSFRNGPVTLLAIQRASPGAASEPATLILPGERVVTDVREHRSLGRTGRVTFRLDPQAPTVLALSDAAAGAPVLQAPAVAAAGTPVTLGIRLADPLAQSSDIVHLAVTAPDGAERPDDSGNIAVRGGRASWSLAMAEAGVWRVTATDLLAGASSSASVTVSR